MMTSQQKQTFWFVVLLALTALCLIAAGALVVNMVQAENQPRRQPMERTPSVRTYEKAAPIPESTFMPPGQDYMINPPEIDKGLPEFEDRDG